MSTARTAARQTSKVDSEIGPYWLVWDFIEFTFEVVVWWTLLCVGNWRLSSGVIRISYVVSFVLFFLPVTGHDGRPLPGATDLQCTEVKLSYTRACTQSCFPLLMCHKEISIAMLYPSLKIKLS